MELLISFIVRSYLWGHPLISLAAIILGIVIICLKSRQQRFLGVRAAFIGTALLLSSGTYFIQRAVPAGTYARISTGVSLISTIAIIVSIIFLFIYAQNSYGTRAILAVLIIKIVSVPLISIITKAIYTNSDSRSLQRSSYISKIPPSLISIAMAVIVFVVFFKNRDKDPVLPKLWIFFLLELIETGLIFLMDLVGSINPPQFYNESDPFQLLSMGTDLASYVLLLVSVIYIIVRIKKAYSEDYVQEED